MTHEEKYEMCKYLKEMWIQTGDDEYLMEYMRLNRRKVDVPVAVDRREPETKGGEHNAIQCDGTNRS